MQFIRFSDREVELDANGSKQITVTVSIPANLVPGTYKGVIVFVDETGFVMKRVPLTVTASEGTRAQVAGIVLDSSGDPVNRAKVEISDGLTFVSDTTGADGKFAIDAIAGATYLLRAGKLGLFPAFQKVTAPVTDLVIRLDNLPNIAQTGMVAWVSGTAELEGRPVQPGDIITAMDSNGVYCGLIVVEKEGEYGPMPVFGDNPDTPDVDEGLSEGEPFFLQINRKGVPDKGPDKPIWQAGTDLVINLGELEIRIVLGDVSGNGYITAFDSTKILRHLVDLEKIPFERQYLADVTFNGEITAFDAGRILQFVVGKIRDFSSAAGEKKASPPLGETRINMPDSHPESNSLVGVPISIRTGGVIGASLTLSYDEFSLAPVRVISKTDEMAWASRNGRLRIALASADPETEIDLKVLFKPVNGTEQASVRMVDLVLNERRVDVSGLVSRVNIIPETTVLLPNYPNPFNPETWIPFRLSQAADVSIRIYNLSGTLLKTIHLGQLDPGYYTSKGRAAYWDGRNEQGERVASGVYIYQMRAGNDMFSKKMVILK